MKVMARGVIAIVVALMGAGTANADDALAKARKAFDDLDYPEAQTALGEAIAEGGHKPAEMIEIYKLSGIAAASSGDGKAATDSFKRLLALSPSATLPSGTSPKIAKHFAAASSFIKQQQPLSVKNETSNDPPSVTIVIDSDPMEMIAKASVTFVVDGKPERTLDGVGNDKIKIDLPHGKRIDLRIAVLDGHKNHLVEMGTRDVPIVITGAEEKPIVVPKEKIVAKTEKPRAPLPWYFKWYLWAGAGVVFTGTATYFGLETRSDAKELQNVFDHDVEHSQADSYAIEDRARRHALFTNISFGLAGAFAIGAGILYILEPKQRDVTPPTGVSVAPTQGGGALVVEGRF